ncbi:MAG: hypothetical protein AB1758_05520 [Candidatus Eremiobacterota bacterium]
MTAYEHQVTLEIADLAVDLEVAFSTQPLARQVLGRDVLAHCVLGLRERALELYMGLDPRVS